MSVPVPHALLRRVLFLAVLLTTAFAATPAFAIRTDDGGGGGGGGGVPTGPTGPAVTSVAIGVASEDLAPGMTVERGIVVTNSGTTQLRLTNFGATLIGLSSSGTEAAVGDYPKCGGTLERGASCGLLWTLTVNSGIGTNWSFRAQPQFVATSGSDTNPVIASAIFGGAVRQTNHLSVGDTVDLGVLKADTGQDLKIDVLSDGASPLTFASTNGIQVAGAGISIGAYDASPIASARRYSFFIDAGALGRDKSATITFNFGAGAIPATRSVTVKWSIVGARLSLSDVNFGTVPIESPASRLATITNTGNGDAYVTLLRTTGAPTFTVSPSYDFRGGGGPIIQVSAGSSIDVPVTCNPQSVGAASGTLEVYADRAPLGTVSSALRCTGVAGGQLDVGPAPINFGTFRVEPVTTTATLSNTGTGPLTVTDIAGVGDDVEAVGVSTPFDLAAGASRTVTLRFTPNPDRDPPSALQVTTKRGSSTWQTTAARGGLLERVPSTSLTVLNGLSDFGDVPLGSSAAGSVRMKNTGNATITLFSVTFATGPGSSAFTVTNPAGRTLAPGATTTVDVKFAPTAPGPVTATLLVDTNAFLQGDIVYSGRGLGPQRDLSASAIDFGDVRPGTAAERTLTVTNSGTADLTFSSVSASGGFTVSGATTPLAAGASRAFTVRYAPTVRGSNSGQLSIITNDRKATSTVSLAGRGAAPQATIVSSVTLPGTVVGSVSTTPVTVTNTGNAPLTVTAFFVASGIFGNPAVTGENIIGTADAPVVLEPGASRSISVRFAPTVAGKVSSTIALGTDDPVTPDRAIPVTGTALRPAALSVAPTPVAFGDVSDGQPKSETVTLSNTGQADLTITSLTATGDASVSGNEPLPFVLTPGASKQVELTFTPTKPGAASGALVVGTSVGTTSIPYTANVLMPTFVASPGALTFGDVPVGDSTTRSFTVSNLGTAPLQLSDIAPSDPRFSVSPSSGTLQPLDDLVLRVTFSPTAVQTYSGEIRMTTNDRAGAHTISLSGAGITPPLFRSPSLVGANAPITHVALGDMNEDGKLDLVWAQSLNSVIGVSLGTGDGRLLGGPTVSYGSGTVRSIDVVDVNGDGHLDVLAGDKQILGDGTGALKTPTSIGLGLASSVGADFDGDGIVDIVGTSENSGSLVGRRSSDGLPMRAPGPVNGRVTDVRDFDRDGDLDVVLSGGAGSVYAVPFSGGTLSAPTPLRASSSETGAAVVGQFTDDLRPDIVTSRRLWRALPDGGFDVPTDVDALTHDTVVADFDGDGNDDVIGASSGGNPADSKVRFSRGRGNGTFDPLVQFEAGIAGNAARADLATGDLNGDGRPDLVVAKGATTAAILLNRTGAVTDGAGKAVISELRLGDAPYVQLQNTDRQRPLRLDGWQVRFSGGGTITLPPSSVIQAGGTLLVSSPTNNGWPFKDLARSVLTIPSGTQRGVALADAQGEPVDAVGFDGAAAGFREGTAITPRTGSSGLTYIRRFSNGARVDTDDNAADFLAIDPEATEASGLVLGSPRPDGLTAPTNRNDILASSLVDPAAASTASPNRVVGGGKLTINRTITNCIGQPKSGVCVNADTTAPGDTVTKLRLRITDLTTIGTAGTGAILKAVASTDATYGALKVSGLVLDAPSPTTGGGLNATLTATLPDGGLGPGESINVAITFVIERGGSYRIGYDAEDDLVARPKTDPPVPAATPAPEAPAPAAVDPAPAPVAAPTVEAAGGTLPQSAVAAPPARTAPPKPPAAAAKRRCVTRTKYRKLSRKQRAKVRICGAASTSKTTKTTKGKTVKAGK